MEPPPSVRPPILGENVDVNNLSVEAFYEVVFRRNIQGYRNWLDIVAELEALTTAGEEQFEALMEELRNISLDLQQENATRIEQIRNQDFDKIPEPTEEKIDLILDSIDARLDFPATINETQLTLEAFINLVDNGTIDDFDAWYENLGFVVGEGRRAPAGSQAIRTILSTLRNIRLQILGRFGDETDPEELINELREIAIQREPEVRALDPNNVILQIANNLLNELGQSPVDPEEVGTFPPESESRWSLEGFNNVLDNGEPEDRTRWIDVVVQGQSRLIRSPESQTALRAIINELLTEGQRAVEGNFEADPDPNARALTVNSLIDLIENPNEQINTPQRDNNAIVVSIATDILENRLGVAEACVRPSTGNAETLDFSSTAGVNLLGENDGSGCSFPRVPIIPVDPIDSEPERETDDEIDLGIDPDERAGPGDSGQFRDAPHGVVGPNTENQVTITKESEGEFFVVYSYNQTHSSYRFVNEFSGYSFHDSICAVVADECYEKVGNRREHIAVVNNFDEEKEIPRQRDGARPTPRDPRAGPATRGTRGGFSRGPSSTIGSGIVTETPASEVIANPRGPRSLGTRIVEGDPDFSSLTEPIANILAPRGTGGFTTTTSPVAGRRPPPTSGGTSRPRTRGSGLGIRRQGR